MVKGLDQEAQQSRNDLGTWDWPARDDPEAWRQRPGRGQKRGSGVLKVAPSDKQPGPSHGDQPDVAKLQAGEAGLRQEVCTPSRQSEGPRQG